MFQAPPFQEGAFSGPQALASGAAAPAFQSGAFQAAIVGRAVEHAFQAEPGIEEEAADNDLQDGPWTPTDFRRGYTDLVLGRQRSERAEGLAFLLRRP
jgi:hypothetical protein